MSAEDEVRKASTRFYNSLSKMARGDSSSMSDAWSHTGKVTAMHPIGGREVSWEAIKKSFDMVGQLASEGEVALKDQIINVIGDVAYEIGTEHGHFKVAGNPVSVDQRVTNIYQRQVGDWKMIHHHADISQPMLDILSRLEHSSAQAAG
jgi:ketosteroid isomerase-like protein